MNKLAIILILIFSSGCGLTGLVDKALVNADAKAVATCIEGSGPPLSGSGKIIIGKVDKEFTGIVEIGADCTIRIEAK